MNSEYDITLHSDETSSPGAARERFLDSLGLGDFPTAAPVSESHTEVTADEIDDEGVVLSSQPDDFDLAVPVAEIAPSRTSPISLGSSPERTRTVAISITAKERTPAALEESVVADSPAGFVSAAVTPSVIPDKTTSFDERLSLECPECHGELVLQRRHIGIEGLCVWCHTPIIAAESARDSIVRIFPVLGRITKPFATPAPVTGELAAPAEPVEVAAPSSEDASAPEAITLPAILAPGPAVVENPEPAAPVETVPVEEAPAAPDCFSPEAFGFGPFPDTTTVPPVMAPGNDNPKDEVSAFDLDSLYATSGFGSPADEPTAPSPGFGEAISNPTPLEATTETSSMTGFGSFLKAGAMAEPAAVSWSTPATIEPAYTVESPAFSAATHWGPPAKLPVTPATGPKDDAPVSLPSDFAGGFETPAPASVVEPTPAPVSETVAENGFAATPWASAFEDNVTSPAASPEKEVDAPAAGFGAAFPMSGFGTPAGQSDFGSFSAPGQPVFSPEETAKPPVDDFAAAFASAGFGAPAAAAPAATQAPVATSGFASFVNGAGSEPAGSTEAVETPDFTFQSSPASKLLFGADAIDEKRSFAMPGNSFSTGSSEESESSSFGSFPAAPPMTTSGSSWGISEPLGLSSPDDAPVTLTDSPLTASLPATGNAPVFEDSPFADFGTNQLPSPVEAPISLFQEPAPMATPPAIPSPAPILEPSSAAAVTIPPLPQTQEPTFSSIANPIEAAPNVVSEPLGSRQKPTVRKGFIVLMVVIVGFAAGAALASFVLPVDEYVQAARALMEKKFNPSAAVEQIPVMPLSGVEEVAPAATAQP